MTTTNPPPLRQVKHLVYDLRTADIPEFIFITDAAAQVINAAFLSLGYDYRIYPISYIKGGQDERPS